MNDNNINIHNQLRFAIEHRVLPQKIEEDPIYVITSIIFEKGKYINKLYSLMYGLSSMTSPYKDEDFTVSNPYDIQGVKAIKIDMPKENLSVSLCESVYIIYNDKLTKYLYVTKELSNDGIYKIASWIDSEHEVHGEVSDNESELIFQIIKDEEISNEKYSDILDELDNSSSSALPTSADEIMKHQKIFTTAMLETQKLKQEKKDDEAFKLIKNIIKTEKSKYQNTENIEYHSFHSAFEVLLYVNLYHPYNVEKNTKKEIIATQVDLASSYLIYGAMMLEKKQFDNAIDILWEAVTLNPVNLQLLFALADAYKGKRFLKTYYNIMKRAHVCAVRKVDIARIYKNFAYYFAQIKNYDLAVSLAYASNYFDSNNELTKSIVNQIKAESGIDFIEPTLDEIKKTLKENQITWGAKDLVKNIVNTLEIQYTNAKNEQGIKLCNTLKSELLVNF